MIEGTGYVRPKFGYVIVEKDETVEICRMQNRQDMVSGVKK